MTGSQTGFESKLKKGFTVFEISVLNNFKIERRLESCNEKETHSLTL